MVCNRCIYVKGCENKCWVLVQTGFVASYSYILKGSLNGNVMKVTIHRNSLQVPDMFSFLFKQALGHPSFRGFHFNTFPCLIHVVCLLNDWEYLYSKIYVETINMWILHIVSSPTPQFSLFFFSMFRFCVSTLEIGCQKYALLLFLAQWPMGRSKSICTVQSNKL